MTSGIYKLLQSAHGFVSRSHRGKAQGSLVRVTLGEVSGGTWAFFRRVVIPPPLIRFYSGCPSFGFVKQCNDHRTPARRCALEALWSRISESTARLCPEVRHTSRESHVWTVCNARAVIMALSPSGRRNVEPFVRPAHLDPSPREFSPIPLWSTAPGQR